MKAANDHDIQVTDHWFDDLGIRKSDCSANLKLIGTRA
jgi:hypothetical protein